MTPIDVYADAVDEIIDEPRPLGIALLVAQGVEFALYDIASHLSHTGVAQKDKRLKNLTPETFLRGKEAEL